MAAAMCAASLSVTIVTEHFGIVSWTLEPPRRTNLT
jgi:hypothetical protein